MSLVLRLGVTRTVGDPINSPVAAVSEDACSSSILSCNGLVVKLEGLVASDDVVAELGEIAIGEVDDRGEIEAAGERGLGDVAIGEVAMGEVLVGDANVVVIIGGETPERERGDGVSRD